MSLTLRAGYGRLRSALRFGISHKGQRRIGVMFVDEEMEADHPNDRDIPPEVTSQSNPETLIETPSATIEARRQRRVQDRNARRREFFLSRTDCTSSSPTPPTDNETNLISRQGADIRTAELSDDSEQGDEILLETRRERAMLEIWEERANKVAAILFDANNRIDDAMAHIESES